MIIKSKYELKRIERANQEKKDKTWTDIPKPNITRLTDGKNKKLNTY